MSVCTIAHAMRCVNEILPPRARLRWLLMTMRLSIISFAGIVRTLVAVGTFSDSSMLAARVFVMPRRGFPVWDLICEDPARLQAEVHPWADGAELEETLLRLVGRARVEEAALLPPLDCKLESMPVAAQEGMGPIMPLGVKH